MKPKYLFPLLCTLLLASCQDSDHLPDEFPLDETIRFTGHTTAAKTRAQTVSNLSTTENIHIIAPGYGTGAADQHSQYTTKDDGSGVLEAVTTEDVIKRSGKNMVFTAWTEPTGVVIADETVDFTADLDKFIGAHEEEENEIMQDVITLGFVHLVGKMSLQVVEVNTKTLVETPVQNAKIIFPAIKQIGKVTTKVTELPKVTPGVSGGELEISLNGSGITTLYLPPLSEDELMMYGAFTIKVNSTDYVGSLSSLSTGAINAEDHIHLKIKITDDHTALLQAINLAPWDEYPRNFYNRPYSGIWGMEDLAALSELINSGADEETVVDGYTLKDFYQTENGQKVVRLYTSITFDKNDEFSPIGTETHPFQNMVLDGNGYQVSGLNMESIHANNLGLLGVVQNITVRDLTVTGSSIEGNDHIGLLIGKSLGGLTVDHCFALNSSLVGSNNVGGLIGTTEATDVIKNCGLSIKSISGTQNIGGIVGENRGLVGNSYTIVSQGISCSDRNVGGLIGLNTGRVENSYSSITYTSIPEANAGALVGSSSAGTIHRCYWNGDCIDNVFCKKVIGDNTAVDSYGLELVSTTTAESYNKSTGYIIWANNNSYYPLRDRLNTSTGLLGTGYLRWATVESTKLPVFGD